jgi:hypothetical protein
MREPHLNPLSLISRSGKCLCLHLPPRDIASILVQVARNLACFVCGAAVLPALMMRVKLAEAAAQAWHVL